MNFHLTIIIIALIFLIIGLIFTGMLMRRTNYSVPDPQVLNKCPDQWVMSSDGCVIPVDGNRGNIIESELNNYNDDNDIFTLRYGAIKFHDHVTPCEKSRFSKHFDITWDGYSNYSRCDL